jgi:hypothetical protein
MQQVHGQIVYIQLGGCRRVHIADPKVIIAFAQAAGSIGSISLGTQVAPSQSPVWLLLQGHNLTRAKTNVDE